MCAYRNNSNEVMLLGLIMLLLRALDYLINPWCQAWQASLVTYWLESKRYPKQVIQLPLLYIAPQKLKGRPRSFETSSLETSSNSIQIFYKSFKKN